MASMYDEYERAVGGKEPRKGSVWGWVMGAVLGMFLLAGVAFVAVTVLAANRAQDVMVDVMADLGDLDESLVIELENLDTGDLHELHELKHKLRHEIRHELREGLRDQAHLRTHAVVVSRQANRVKVESRAAAIARALQDAEGERAALAEESARMAEESALLAEQVAREVSESVAAMTLSLDGDRISMELFSDQDGGSFVLDMGGEEYRVDLEGDDEGGRLVLTTPEGESIFHAGASAQSAPGWVPRFPGSSHPGERVFSGDLADMTGGAELSETSDSPLEVMQYFQDALEDSGFDVRTQNLRLDSNDVQGSLVGTHESDGRTVAVVVVEEDGQTRLLTFWGNANQI